MSQEPADPAEQCGKWCCRDRDKCGKRLESLTLSQAEKGAFDVGFDGYIGVF